MTVSFDTDASRAWRGHLDACPQCRDNPFALCPEGARLLDAAGESIGVPGIAKGLTEGSEHESE